MKFVDITARLSKVGVGYDDEAVGRGWTRSIGQEFCNNAKAY
jgi:hypothetical protein